MVFILIYSKLVYTRRHRDMKFGKNIQVHGLERFFKIENIKFRIKQEHRLIDADPDYSRSSLDRYTVFNLHVDFISK